MRYTLSTLLTFAMLAALCAKTAAEVPQIAVPIVAVPITIRIPGIYVLRKDLNFNKATGAAITIAADNVVLDLGGRTLTNTLPANASTPSAAIGILSTQYVGTTVRNGHIVGFNDAVNLAANGRAGTIVAEHLQIDDCRRLGVSISGDQVEVQECRVRNIGDAAAPSNVWGLNVIARSAHIASNEIYGVTSPAAAPRGIQLSTYVLGVVEKNRVINSAVVSGSNGILLFNAGSAVASNMVSGNFIANWGNGISFANSSAGKFRDNLTQNCNVPFSGGTAVGTANN